VYAVIAVSKSMQAVELCSNKILQFLTVSAGKIRLNCVMAIKLVVVVVVVVVFVWCKKSKRVSELQCSVDDLKLKMLSAILVQ